MREIILIIENLDAVIATMLNDMDEATFLRKYEHSKPIQIAYAMGSRSLAKQLLENVEEVLEEEE